MPSYTLVDTFFLGYGAKYIGYQTYLKKKAHDETANMLHT